MKKQLSAFALSIAAFANPAHAIIGAVDNVPAATLLLPYFDVDTVSTSGTRTTMTVGNSSAAPVLARVQLWSDLGVATHSFYINLEAYGMREIDLRNVFVNGTFPSSTSPNGSCAAFVPAPALSAAMRTELVNAHRGSSSTFLGSAQCFGNVQSDGHARGYVTVDAANTTCVATSTSSPGYFVNGGTGVASNANVLWGEYSISNATDGSAFGDTLVHIEASGSDPLTTTSGNHTFYGRLADVNGSTKDNREALPQEYFGRYQFQGAITGTKAMVWRDAQPRSPFTCGSPPAALTTIGIVAFDHQEQVAGNLAAVKTPSATQLVDLKDTTRAVIPYNQGFVSYSLGRSTGAGTFTDNTLNQAYVSHVLNNGAGNAGQTSAWPIWPLENGSNYIAANAGSSECSDGIDNDGDGNIDFPADTSCLNAQWLSERPECSDGLNNDGVQDALVDFPADPGCRTAFDLSEDDTFDNQCGDGINNNDGDTLIDFPTDTGCFGFNDQNERRLTQCDNGTDDDGDLLIDFPADPGCSSQADGSELFPQCSDGIDNDGDTRIDFPADPGCTDANDNAEVNAACNDGLDNDGDTFIDFPADIGCTSLTDTSENNVQCSDGLDNDGDTFIDFPADPGCASAQSVTEQPQCSDMSDNDFDGLTDFPNDPACQSLSDNSETFLGSAAQCSDGLDNDGDGRIDFPNEPGCSSTIDDFEGPDCADGNIDNDFDGLADFGGGSGNDPGCASATDQNELGTSTTRQCSDGMDNDADGLADFPIDPGCASAWDDVEFNPNQTVALGQQLPVPSLNGFGLLAMIFSVFAGLWLTQRRNMV